MSQHGMDHNAVLRLLTQKHGLGDVHYRIEVLRSGIPVMSCPYKSCTIECNSSDEVKRHLRMTIEKTDDIIWESDLIRPVMHFLVKDKEFSFPIAKFKATTVRNSIVEKEQNGIRFKGTGNTQVVEAYDESITIQENSLGEVVYFPAGMLNTAAVEALLEKAGVSQYRIEPSPKVLHAAKEDWDESVYIIKAVNELLEEIGYNTISANREGELYAGPYEEPSISRAKIHYAAGVDSLVYLSKEIEYDTYKKANYHIGIASNPDLDDILRYDDQNTDSSSPTSIPRTGYRRTEVIKYNDIADYDTLVKKVQRRKQEVARNYETVTLTTANMPHHDIGEVITVNADGVQGVYEETGWSMNFSGRGAMTHTLRKLIL